LVKDVKVSLRVVDVDDPRALEQVRPDRRAGDSVVLIELNLDELPEPRRVVVSHRLRVSERLQERVGLQDLLLHRPRVVEFDVAVAAGLAAVRVRAPSPHVREVLHDLLRRLRLPRAGLAAD
jgi:hypothetical protein